MSETLTDLILCDIQKHGSSCAKDVAIRVCRSEPVIKRYLNNLVSDGLLVKHDRVSMIKILALRGDVVRGFKVQFYALPIPSNSKKGVLNMKWGA